MLTAGPVARFALQLSGTEWAACIGGHAVRIPEYCHQRIVVAVAAEAGISSVTAVGYLAVVRRLRERGRTQKNGQAKDKRNSHHGPGILSSLASSLITHTVSNDRMFLIYGTGFDPEQRPRGRPDGRPRARPYNPALW
jgi:hypothetical protein